MPILSLRVLLLLLLWPLGLPLRGAPSNAELKIAVTQEFENLNPLIMQMYTTSFLYKMVGRCLNVLDADGQIVEQLAERTPTLENGLAKWEERAGQRTLVARWRLKDAARWGDGTPVTAADVRFSWQVALSETVSVGERETYAEIADIVLDAEDAKAFTLVYKTAKWDFHKLFTFYIIPRHLEEAIFTRHGKEPLGYEKNTLYVREPTNPGLYNGPYRVQELQLGSHVTLVPNPHFYGPAPKIQRLIIRLVPATATLEANLRGGTVDMISEMGFTLDQALAFEARAREQGLPFTVNFRDSLFYEHVDLNLDHPILREPAVRRALTSSIDRQALCQALFGGRQKPALHFIAPLDPWFTAEADKITVHRHSPRQAGKLLEDAGWRPGPDGIRVKNGERLSLNIMSTAGDKTREQVQAFLQEEWRKIGVELTIRNEPARVLFGETIRKRQYGAMAMYAWVASPENPPRSTLHGESVPSEANGWSGQNTPGWKNPEVDRLIGELEREFDPTKRLALIHGVLKHYTSEVPVIPLYYRADNSVTPAKLRGYRLTGHMFSSSNAVEHWHFAD